MRHLSVKILEKGQTLVLLVVFVVVGIIVASSATIIILLSSKNASNFELGIMTLQLADSGAENALLRLLRNPSYAGETINTQDGTITINVTGDDQNKTITSTARVSNFLRTIKVDVNFAPTLTIISWKEIY